MTARKKRSLIIDSVTRPLPSQKRNKQETGFTHAFNVRERHNETSKKIYLNLNIYAENSDRWDDPVLELRSGECYTLVLKSSSIRKNSAQEVIELEEDFSIFLQWKTDNGISVDISQMECRGEYSNTFREDSWPITVPDNLPPCQLTCRILYLEAESQGSTICDRQTFSVINSNPLTDPVLLTVSKIANQPPENVAVLVIEPYHQTPTLRAFKLRGWSSLRNWEEASNSEAIVSLPKLMERGEQPWEIRGKIRRFSESVLLYSKKWLIELYEKYQEHLCLVFIDQTKLEIPWEMFELKEGVYIGAQAQVVRWIVPPGGSTHQLEVQENDLCRGSAIAYLDKGLGHKETQNEQMILQKIARSYSTLKSLERRLRQPLKEIGLIYIGCHGDNGRTLQEQHPDHLTANVLELIDIHRFPHRPIVFINACESGRILHDEWNNNSLVEVLLHRCVRGYIGALGKIGTIYASSIAQHILELAYQENDGVLIADILRCLRRDALCRLKAVRDSVADGKERDEKEVQHEYEMLYTFLYVYYGNPLARLHLQRVNSEDNI